MRASHRLPPVLPLLLLALAACEASPSPSASTADSASAAPTASSAATVVASAAASARAEAEAEPSYNVLLITVDSMREDRMPWEDYPHQVVPNIARLAEGAVKYTQFYSLSSFTAMTFGGLMAGRYPSEVRRSSYFFSNWHDDVETFPEQLGDAVHSMAGHAHWYFGPEKANLDQGFDDWALVDGIEKNNETDESVTSDKHVALAKKQLQGWASKAKAGDRFFAWYHLMDPHDQYIGHAGTPVFGRGARGAYDGELHWTDKHLGQLFDFVESQPWGKETAIIISADHGETFGEHDMYRHGFELWQPLIHVPLIVKVPGVAPATIDEPRSAIDLPRTIMDLLGATPTAKMRGQSLVPELRGTLKPSPRPVIADLPRTSDNDRRRAFIDGRYKLITHGDDDYFKLYDLKDDPNEQVDLATRKPELLAEVRKKYEAFIAEHIEERCPDVKSRLKGKKEGRDC